MTCRENNIEVPLVHSEFLAGDGANSIDHDLRNAINDTGDLFEITHVPGFPEKPS